MNHLIYFAFLILIFSTTALKWNEKRLPFVEQQSQKVIQAKFSKKAGSLMINPDCNHSGPKTNDGKETEVSLNFLTKHKLKTLQPNQLTSIINQFNLRDFESILDPMLIPRVAGSPACKKVRKYIADFFTDLKWSVEEDTFVDKTPYGDKEFTNVIATLDPKAPRRLVLACHYDSKLNREQTFVMATDSAVPCAILMSMAEDMQTYLGNPRVTAKDVTLQFMFFDGEEAFVEWSATDSLYGSRHLAKQLEKIPYPPGSRNTGGTTELDRIDAFVLLDLLGAPDPKFRKFFTETGGLYDRLAAIERSLHQKKQLINHLSANQYFTRISYMFGGVEDDHVPFHDRGVPILHLIPSPFPTVWHKESDNKDNLDFDVIENLCKIFRVFVAEYLHLVVGEDS